MQVRNGHIKRLTDSDIQSSVLAPRSSSSLAFLFLLKYLLLELVLFLIVLYRLLIVLILLLLSFSKEIMGTNVSTTYITCPADPSKTLGIKLPFLAPLTESMFIDFISILRVFS